MLSPPTSTRSRAQRTKTKRRRERLPGARLRTPPQRFTPDFGEVHGFTMDQLLSEYRALRASVLRLWIEAFPSPDRTNLVDIMRFNEAIDQATAEATARFTRELRHSRDLFLAMLGHDLRNPLNAIALSAQSLMRARTRDLPSSNRRRHASASARSG